MIDYPDNVRVGDVVRDHATGAAYDVIALAYREGRGWEVDTRAADGYRGPQFYPHPDRMPDPDRDPHNDRGAW